VLYLAQPLEEGTEALDTFGEMDGYLTLPVRPIELMAYAKVLVRLGRLERRQAHMRAEREKLGSLNTELKRQNEQLAELAQALRENEKRLRMIAENVPNVLFEADPSGAVTYLSAAWTRLTGRSMEEGLGEGWADFLHPDDRAQVTAIWAEAVRCGELRMSRHRFRAADGSYRWVSVRAVPLKDPDGSVRRWFGDITDVHDETLAREALRESEERFRQLAENIRDVFWLTDPGKNQMILRQPGL
jgi:PAS domain S-box-containing protein